MAIIGSAQGHLFRVAFHHRFMAAYQFHHAGRSAGRGQPFRTDGSVLCVQPQP